MYASSFDVHDRFCQQDCVHFGTAVWMRSLPIVPYGNDWLLVSNRIEYLSASWAMHGCGSAHFAVDSIALNKCIGLATNGSAVILLQHASRSCRGLRVGIVVAGDLQGFVDDQQLQIVCTLNSILVFHVSRPWHVYELCSSGAHCKTATYKISLPESLD